ncbi:MAG: hypothetical protein CSA44_00605 [Gammaproteobacteria bacterium]|nr:MAG: hypothetical protein CSA44_00605 [Gammaproteobacteria bacterium]
MKRFIINTIKFSIPILILVASVNYLGDAARLFHNDYEKKIVNILASGKLVTNISNYDERILQKEIINFLNPKPDVLVIGSSRTMLIKQAFIPNNKTIYNSSVSGASIEDLIAIYQMYKEKNSLPSRIIIGIDPWMFNKNNGQTRWKSIEKEYNAFFEKKIEHQSVSNSLDIRKYKQLLSFSYFQSSLKLMPNLFKRNSSPIPTDIEENKTLTKLKDGTIKYGNSYRLQSPEQVKRNAIGYKSNKPIYSLGNYTELSNDSINKFNSLLKSIKDEGIDVAFFLAPYHSIVYEEIEKSYPKVLKSEEFIIECAKQNSYPVIGSFDPAKIQIDKLLFYDGMHLKEESVKKMLKDNQHVQQWLNR